MNAVEGQPFSRSQLREYLTALDDVLGDGPTVALTVCGGASIMWRHQDRLSNDVDVLAPALEAEVVGAVAVVAKAYGLSPSWLNDSVAKMSALERPPSVERMFTGRRLVVDSVDAETLLAMKLVAQREHDIEDAVLLIQELGVTEFDVLNEIVGEAYDWRFPQGAHGWSESAKRAIESANASRPRRLRRRRRRKQPKAMKRTRRPTRVAPEHP